MSKPDPDNIWKFIKIPKDPKGCWIWLGHLSYNGYGRLRFGMKDFFAHRFVWEYLVGEIPKGLNIDHLCRVKKCVNPDHLEPVTQKINNNRGLGNQNKKKTHCIHGHPFNEKNTYKDNVGSRHCRPCRVNDARRFREKVIVLNV